jgi:predicted transcriptional regulator
MESDNINEEGINYIVTSLVSLGLNEKAAQVLTYLNILDNATFFQISKRTGLRQPEFSIAINDLKDRGWIGEEEKKKPGRGRPFKIYSLRVTFAQILAELEREQKKKQDEEVKLMVKQLKGLVKK